MKQNLMHYQRALYLRKKKGYNYREIMDEVPVAKSTLSNWLSTISLSEQQQKRIRDNWLEQQRSHLKRLNIGEWNRAKRQKDITRLRIDAKQAIGKLSDRELLIAGIMLFWAEGHKNGKDVRITNADPAFVRLIMVWFRKSLNIPDNRFSASIHFHQGQDELQIKKFWSDVTNIPLAEFKKSFCKPPGTGHRKHYLQWGVLTVRVKKSADLAHTLFGWRDGLIIEAISSKHRGRP